NGRRAGLRRRCPAGGVRVRPPPCPLLRPARSGNGDLHRAYLALRRVGRAAPDVRGDEQRPPFLTAEDAREAAAVEVDHLGDLATFADTSAALVRDVRVPDRVLGIEADPVGVPVDLRPKTASRQAAVGRNLEG